MLSASSFGAFGGGVGHVSILELDDAVLIERFNDDFGIAFATHTSDESLPFEVGVAAVDCSGAGGDLGFGMALGTGGTFAAFLAAARSLCSSLLLAFRRTEAGTSPPE